MNTVIFLLYLDMSSLETVSIISLLKTSHILLFDDVSRRSEETLLTRVEQEIPGSCLQVLLVAGELGLSNLKKISLRLAVDKFDKLNIEDLASLGNYCKPLYLSMIIHPFFSTVFFLYTYSLMHILITI